MITISNCSLTGLKRKLTYDFYWLSSSRRIVIQCFISHYNELDELVENARIVSYQRPLIASDNLVNKLTGHIFTTDELSNMTLQDKEDNAMYEYDFYVSVIGAKKVLLPVMLENVIKARDLEGKFDI